MPKSRKGRKVRSIMAEKITKAMNDGAARTNAVEVLGLGNYAKVSNTEFALTVKNAEGNDTVVVVKLTVPKAQLSIDEMVNIYEAERAAKKAEKEAKKANKETKITEEDIDF